MENLEKIPRVNFQKLLKLQALTGKMGFRSCSNKTRIETLIPSNFTKIYTLVLDHVPIKQGLKL